MVVVSAPKSLVRVSYKRHRAIIRRASKKLGVSDAEVVRRALKAFAV